MSQKAGRIGRRSTREREREREREGGCEVAPRGREKRQREREVKRRVCSKMRETEREFH